MSVIPSRDSTQYWAAELDSGPAAANVIERIRRYRRWLKESGRANRMTRSWRTYYGFAPDGTGDTSRTSQSGEQGEYVDVTTNDFATLVTQTAVLTTQNKPGLHAIATNADFDSLAQTEFAQGLLESYDKKHAVQDRDFETVVTGLLSSEGWEIEGWDATGGKSLTDFVDAPALNEGDIRIHSTTPFRVAYDFDAQDIDSLQWIAFKRRYNRFDLAKTIEASKPDVAEKLRAMSTDSTAKEFADGEGDGFEVNRHAGVTTRESSGDLVWIWEFRHLPSPALPNGRLMRFASDECVLFDSIEVVVDADGAPVLDVDGNQTVKDHGYPYSELHAQRFSPDTMVGSIAGHTAAFDMLGLQELVDTMATMGASAANAGGITNMWTQSGDKPEPSGLIGGMNFIQSKTKPEILKGIELSPQVAIFEEFVMKRMMRRLGQSDVSMGEVPKGMPGNLAALLEAKTVQYHSRGQASYAQMIERRATSTLKILQKFAKTDRVAVIGGKANEWKYKSWKDSDIKGVDRFVVESISPLLQSYAGKQTVADKLLDKGLIQDGRQYITLVTTGEFEPLVDSVDANLMRIRKEKEMLQEGIGLPPIDVNASFAASQKASQAAGKTVSVPVFIDPPQGKDGKVPPCIRPFIYDQHWLDIPEYLAVAAMPMARDKPEIVAAVTGVIEEKIRLMKQIDPVMLAVLKCPPEVAAAISMAQMPPPMLGMPPDGTQPPAPGQSSGSKPPKQAPAPGLPSGAPPIAPARPPKDPLTGVQAPSPVSVGAQQ